jgi:hypothetical protein
MGLIEKDPRDIAFIALHIAIKWYQEISADTALRIAKGESHAVPEKKLTPEILEKIKKVIFNSNFSNIDNVVKRFRVNKYDIYKALSKDKGNGQIIPGEEVIVLAKIEIDLRKLKDRVENCSAGNCENCVLNSIVYGNFTLCEILEDIQFDKSGNLVQGKGKAVYQKYTKSILAGSTRTKSFKMYESAVNELEEFKKKHENEKIQDIISAAVLEYIDKRNMT